jgi:hypothetical protein
MKTTRTPLILAIGVLAAGISSANGQNLISNASFEDPPLPTPNTYVFELPTDWNQNLDANSLPIIFNGTIPGWPSPEQGNQLLDIGNSSGNSAGVNQTFTVTVPGTYDLTWYDNAEIGEPHTYSVSLGGTTVDFTNGVGSTTWTEHELSVVLSGSATLTFDPILGGVDTLLDNVQLQPAQASVPDGAGTFGLLNLALGGMAVLARRLRRHH